MIRVIGCITGEHDPRLVALAACICALACFTTLNLMRRARQPGASWVWLLAAAILFGCGVWSLHFVAMLGFVPATSIAYDVKTTFVSAVVASVGALSAFLLWAKLPFRPAAILVGGSMLGLAIAAMHYTGVAAMELPRGLNLDPVEAGASVAVGVAFATLGLSRAEQLEGAWRRVEVSVWLALAICGLHFTAMTALRLDPGAHPSAAHGVLGSMALAVAVGSVSLAILLVSLAATLMDQHLSDRALGDLRRLQLLSDVSQEVQIIHRDGTILHVNTAGGRLLAMGDELIGRDVLTLFPDRWRMAVVGRREVSPDGSDELEIQLPCGSLIPVEVRSSQIEYEGKPATVLSLRDLSDRKRHEERIRHLAHHDALTDLPNRFLLSERLTQAIAAPARSGSLLAVLFIDLDRFKSVNDLWGHSAGDRVLIEVTDRLRGEVRAGETLARIGGDEFVVITQGADNPEKVASFARSLIAAVSRPFEFDGHGVEVGASIGIALYPADGDSPDALLHAADTALCRAKQDQKGSYRFFEPSMNAYLYQRLELEQSLRRAIEREELEVYYQPLVNCTTGEIDGYEALLRWHHPERGIVPPSDFIPLAEETGLIIKIGQWIIRKACLTAAAWDGAYRVAVNVSPVQFRHGDLVQAVADALAESGLPAAKLEIEITESVLIDDSKNALGILRSLRELGVGIALDDFGTGYSSLSYLQSFRFDKLKIDRSFVAALGEKPDSEMIVRTIIALAHNLGLAVVAEGVETVPQLTLIRDLLCDQVQGYLLGRPAPVFGDRNEARVRALVFDASVQAAEREIEPALQ